MIAINQKKFIFLLAIILVLAIYNPLKAEWITKKSDISKELLKVDDMYSKGYLTISECTQMKAKLLKISNAEGMCDDVITVVKGKSKELLKVDDMYSKGYLTISECTKMKAKLLKISNAEGMCDDVITVVKSKGSESKSFDWMAEVKHPKTNKIFKATRLSTKDKAINLAIKKCYKYVTSSLNKIGYNDCYVSKSVNVKNDQTESYKIAKTDNTELGSWVAVVEHKQKNIFYESEVKSSKQDAINDAISKCWFDWRHKEGDWPSENCILISSNNKEKKSSYITKKEKDLSKKLITKKEESINHYEKIKNLPNAQQYYFIAFGDNNLKIIGYVNTDPQSETIKLGNFNVAKTSLGYAFVNDKKTTCNVVSEVDGAVSENIYKGNAILDCKNKGKYFGGWVQQNKKGEGIGIDDNGNQLKFYFVDNKIDAYNIKSPYTDFAKIPKEQIEKEYVPKEGVVNKAPIITVDLEQNIKPGTFNLVGNVIDNEQTNPPYLFIDDEKIDINEDGSFEYSMFALNDIDVTVLAVDKRGEQKEVIVKVLVEKVTQTVEKLQKLNPQKIKSKVKKDRLAVIIGIEKYVSIQNATYAKSDAEYFTEYAKRAFGIESKNIKTLIDDQADFISSKKALFKWLRQRINKDQTEVLIFYSGHGLASLDDEELFLLTNDSDGDFIEDTALSRTSIIERIASFNPKTVTMFIDACYSGETRDSNDDELLIASAKPVKLLEDDSKLPDNFNMFSASQISQASSSTKKETGVKNGIFSYYLMKGLEGSADLNKDRRITNGELYEYLSINVPKIARSLHNREQEPFFKGDTNSVLVRF